MDLFTLSAVLTLDTSQYEQKIGMVEGVTSGVSKGIGTAFKLGATAIAGATAAVGAFGASSVKSGADFDKSMAQVGATMLKTTDEMEKEVGSVDTAYGHFEGNLRDFAQFLGRETTFSATQAADALNYMALAGYDTQQSMDMLPNVLSLAAAGGFDLARASDMVTDAQTAFGINAERTTQMVDEMAKAASTGNTSVEQMGDAFLVVGGLAKELNGGMVTLADGTQKPVDGLQELEIALTAMANAGVKGSEAGTHMRNMLLKLSDPTDDGAAWMEELGVSIWDAEGNMRSLKDIMGDLSGALGNLTQEEKIKAISDLFNTRDMASAEALLGAVEQDWDAIGESILNAEGSAAEMSKIQLDNLAGDITLFKSALEGAQIAVSDELTPSLRDFVQFGTKGLSELTGAFKEGGLSGAMKSLGGLISEGLTLIIDKLPDFVDAGLQLLGAVAKGLVDNAPTIMTAITQVAQTLWGYVVSVGPQVITALWQGITEGLPKLVDAAVQIMSNLGAYLGQAIPQLLPVALQALMEFSANLRENAGRLVDAALGMIIAIGEGLIASLPELIKTVPTIVTNIAGIINDNAPKVLSAGIELIGKLLAGIVQAVPTLIAEFPKILQAIISVIFAINWIQLGSNIIKFIENGVKALAKNLPNALKNIGKQGMEWLKALNWRTLGKDIIDLIKIGVQGLAKAIPNALKSIGQSALKAFGDIDWWGLGKNIISGIVSGITGNVGAIVDAARDAASNAFEAAKNFLGIESPSKLFRSKVGKMIAEGMALGIGDGETDVISAIGDLNDDMSDIEPAEIESDIVLTKSTSTDSNGNPVGGMNFAPVLNIYGSEGQDVQELARIVMDELTFMYNRERAAYGTA